MSLFPKNVLTLPVEVVFWYLVCSKHKNTNTQTHTHTLQTHCTLLSSPHPPRDRPPFSSAICSLFMPNFITNFNSSIIKSCIFSLTCCSKLRWRDRPGMHHSSPHKHTHTHIITQAIISGGTFSPPHPLNPQAVMLSFVNESDPNLCPPPWQCKHTYTHTHARQWRGAVICIHLRDESLILPVKTLAAISGGSQRMCHSSLLPVGGHNWGASFWGRRTELFMTKQSAKVSLWLTLEVQISGNAINPANMWLHSSAG